MGEVNRGDGQIFQIGNRGVKAVTQRHGGSRTPRFSQQFPGSFATW
jgi:hypothetical protein